MASLLFYRNLLALDRDQHKTLKVKPAQDLKFTGDATVLPIVLGEFAEVSREFPITFLRVADGGLLPVALAGLPGGKNLYLDESGKWNAPYIPAFVRRYPFIFAETGPDQLTLCIDRDFEGFNETEGLPLFNDDGEPGELVNGALTLLAEFQRQHLLTQAFVKRLDEAGILMEASANATLADGRGFTLQGLLVVDEQKLRAISDETLKQWFASGELGLIYAHLLSLGNLLELVRRQPAAAPAAEAEAKPAAEEKPADKKPAKKAAAKHELAEA